jgi:hypothetical protein
MLTIRLKFCEVIERLTCDSIHQNRVQRSSLDLVARIGSLGLTDCLLEFARARQLVLGEEALFKYTPLVPRETRSVRGCK